MKLNNKKGMLKGIFGTKKKDFARFSNELYLADKLYLDINDKRVHNLNEVIIGESGVGKTFRKIIPDVLQMVGSYVISDPRNEVYEYTHKALKENGYDIKVLNILQYNPFKYINKETLATDISSLIDCFIENTSNKQEHEQFWDNCMKDLLTAIVFYLVLEENEEKNFKRVFDLVSKVSIDEGTGEINESKTELERIFNKIRIEQPYHPGLQAYKDFKKTSGKTVKSILKSLTARLNIFISSDMCAMTYGDEIELEKIGMGKIAIFLKTSDIYEYKKLNVLVSMFYTQLFKVLCYEADSKYNGRFPYLVSCEFDEFVNSGKIPNFDTYMATISKRNIRVAITLQGVSQLKGLYKNWKRILNGCGIFNYMGLLGYETQEYLEYQIQEYIEGKFGIPKIKTNQLNEFFNNEKNSIVLVRGMTPFFVKKIKTESYPIIKEVNVL